jgi:hypothetical protein
MYPNSLPLTGVFSRIGEQICCQFDCKNCQSRPAGRCLSQATAQKQDLIEPLGRIAWQSSWFIPDRRIERMLVKPKD